MKKIIFFLFLFLVLVVHWLRASGNDAEKEKAQPFVAGDMGVAEFVETETGNVTMDFKAADIHNVLRILSYKGGMNIVVGEDVAGMVTIRLTDVPWETALDTILKTYDLGYEKEGNIISVTTLEKLTQRNIAAQELQQVQPLVTKVFHLKYIDAGDAKNVLEGQLSHRGRITILEVSGQKGWEFKTDEGLTKRERKDKEAAKSKTLVVSDLPDSMEIIEELLKDIDKEPKRILIEARIMEVGRDKLKDIGVDWGSGSDGATALTLKKQDGSPEVQATIKQATSAVAPNIFGPKATDIGGTGAPLFNTGLTLVYQKLIGKQFRAVLHALEEDEEVNTLSAPHILTLDNQEATILVGTKYPIVKSEIESGVITTTLDRYLDIGIQLNVVPQVSDGKYINMIVHPAVTEKSGITVDNYPEITTREAETQILMRSGETIVIGGLYKDVKREGKFSVPVLGKIPLLGFFFQRKTYDTEKVELLIFITATIMPEYGDIEEEEMVTAAVTKKEEIVQ